MFMAGAVRFGGIRATARTVAPRSLREGIEFRGSKALSPRSSTHTMGKCRDPVQD